MADWTGKLYHTLLGRSLDEASFARRGFVHGTESTRAHLEQVGMTFLAGYNSALRHSTLEGLTDRLQETPRELTGFAYEGAAMGLTLLDQLLPWRRGRLDSFLKGPGYNHYYMVHVGAGWALARLGRRLEPFMRHLDPVHRWLVIDGYGFHDGYFHPTRTVTNRERPGRLSGYAVRAFDQGLGRALWFVCGADVEQIAVSIETFKLERQADLWSGIGLACAYAGKASQSDLRNLYEMASEYRPQLAQGAAFAAKSRIRAHNAVEHTQAATQEWCGMSDSEAAAVTDQALKDLKPEGDTPAYEVWRCRIQGEFARRGSRV